MELKSATPLMSTRLNHIRLHHVGVITGNLEGSMTFYTSLGYTASVIYHDLIQEAHIVLMHREHEPVIELIAPKNSNSPAAGWMDLIQVGPYHTCYEVDDLDCAMAFFKHQNLFPVFGPVPAIAFNQRRVVFLWSESSGLIELLETNSSHSCML